MIQEVDVCIAGGGPAGMILGLLLAKQGIKVLVLEQHKDFEREYRGEVLMPRFVQMMKQIGLFDELEKSHHLKLEALEGFYRGKRILQVGFKDISPEVPFALWMPQPVLLNFLHQKALYFPSYQILFEVQAKSLIEEQGAVKGLTAETSRKEKVEVRSKIVVGADGRFSILRKYGGFKVADEDYHFDILWFSLPRPSDFDNQVRFFLDSEYNYLILPKYPDLIQCGLIVPRGEYAKLRHEGIEAVRKILLRSHPLFHSFARGLQDFEPFSLLQAKIEYVQKWARDGAVLIGDSAHTCSPAGAVGVSVAVASAIVAADVITQSLAAKDYSERQLGKIQEIRQAEVLEIQKAQKNFTRLFLAKNGIVKLLLPFLLFFASRLGLFQAAQRRLLVMSGPLPVSPKLKF